MFQQCNVATECNWDPSIYFNRDCSGEWRCMEGPQTQLNLCSYGCLEPPNVYCGDGICGGVAGNEWSCSDCNEDIAFIGSLSF